MSNDRSGSKCLVCGYSATESIPTITSSFISARAWAGGPERTSLIRCPRCDFRFFQRGLSAVEAENYYMGYRDSAYLLARASHEWFYTRKLHTDLSDWMSSPERSKALNSALGEAGFSYFERVLDYGGGSGHLMSALHTNSKFVFDMSNATTLPGVKNISASSSIPEGAFDCVICAQTLEHCSQPSEEIRRIAKALAPSGILYLELPNEHWTGSFRPNRAQLALLEGLLFCAEKSPFALKLLDTIFTGLRVKFGVLPSFGFVPMREHLNYFSSESMRQLVVSNGFGAPIAENAQYRYLIAQKNPTGEVANGCGS